MNLLPKSHSEFAQTEYWNEFFKKRGTKAFEWYGEYPELCEFIHKYTRKTDNVLMVGCGNSKLSMDMYDAGFKEVTNIDISHVVIKQMIALNKNLRPDMKYLQMDATAMEFGTDQFHVVLDKGTLDALMPNETEDILKSVTKYCEEIDRVLRIGGRYLCVSLLQEHILKFLLHFFPNRNYMFRIVRCFQAEEQTSQQNKDEKPSMPVFIVIATKLRNPMKIFEIGMSSDKMERMKTEEDILTSILAVQRASFLCNNLQKCNIAGFNEVSIDLYQPGFQEPRYTVHIVDQPPVRGNKKFAAFIVPQGREIEWLFLTPQGRKKLLLASSHNRLAIASMHRDQEYKSLDHVKDELAEIMTKLAPKNLKEKILYLSLGSELGKRENLFKGKSDLSGEYVIEECEGVDGKLFRRLIFLKNQSIIQSEALIKIQKQKNKQPKKVIDHSYLACQHHLFMVLGVVFNKQRLLPSHSTDKPLNVLIIGLGGGGLCMFLHKVLRNVQITAVEIDPTMVEIAENYFDLKQDDRMKITIADGLKYLKENSNGDQLHFDAILFDVDSKDLSLGMSCPPKQFTDTETLNAVNRYIGSNGIFILNLVCRDEQLREQVLNDVKRTFASSFAYKLEEDLNEIVYCWNDKSVQLSEYKTLWNETGVCLNQSMEKLKIPKDDLIDIENFLDRLKIC